MTARPQAGGYFPALCFGKLPAFGDFVRHNAGGRDVLAFDHWLQQGLHHARLQLRGDWDDSFRRAPAYHFVFFPENSESFLLGRLQPSHDRSERRFPFVVALRVDRRFPPELLPLAPVVFAPFLDGATGLMRSVDDGTTRQGIADAAEQLHVPVAQDYRALVRAYLLRLASARLGDLWTQLWGRTDDERACVVLQNLLEVLTPLHGRNPDRLALGLRFPVAGDPPDLGHLVSFWLEAAFRLVGARAARPFLFWTAPRPCPPAPGTHLFVFLRQPTARSLLYLLRPDLTSDLICAMDVDERNQRPRAALPKWVGAALTEKDGSPYRLLEALGARGPNAVVRPGAPC